jgi:hypothetical protein
MRTLLSKSIYQRLFAKAALLGLMVLCGAAGPVVAQEKVSGRFTLTKNTRFGNKFLEAGAYTFSIGPTGVMQTLDSVQGMSQPVLVTVCPETKAGPVVVIFALASRSEQTLDSSKIIVGPEDNGMAMHTMYLSEQGLVLDFDWWSPKGKTQMIVQRSHPAPAQVSKGTD